MPFENFGKYVLLEKLATGGMAEVFLARGTGAGGIGKFFAVKRILPQYADSPEFIEMFKDEAKIAINLNHSNIVSIHEFGVEKGQFFLVMDYVEGRNLRQILNKMKKTSSQFTLEQIVYVIKEVAAGLDHAHRCIDGSTGKPLNITHRDISPQNLMVSFEGEVKIVDFGIAKAESQIENTRAGTLKGKFGYMSPEQAEGQVVDLRTDIFSLGIVLWELLANDRLFVANNEINTLRKIRDCHIPSLRKINPNIHAELERIALKALARDRNLRFQTAAALHRDLNRFLNRQYPDFSTHDFAVTIKDVFSDELMSLRKRLVDYSKANLTMQLSIPAAVATPVAKPAPAVNSGTISIVDGPQTDSEIVAKPTLERGDSGFTRKEETSTDLSNPPVAETQQTTTLPPLPEASPQSSGTGTPVLDVKALESAAQQGSGTSHDATRIVTGPVTGTNLSVEQVRVVRTQERRPQQRPRTRKAAGTPRIATFMVFIALCAVAYIYLVKNHTNSMSDVIVMTDPFLRPLHEALGVQPKEVDLALKSPMPAPNPGPAPAGNPASASAITPAPAPVPAPVPAPAPSSTAEPADQALVVTSTPSGAEIYIDNLSTGMVTPSRIQVPATKSFSIHIKKKGYVDFRRLEVTHESLGRRLDATLIKLSVGFLDVEIFPPQEAILYVDGKQVALSRDGYREITVPGNTQVHIRAESPGGASFDEQVVTVGVDKRRTIRLNPKRALRKN